MEEKSIEKSLKQECTGIIIDYQADIRESMSEYLEMQGFKIIGNGSNGCHAGQ